MTNNDSSVNEDDDGLLHKMNATSLRLFVNDCLEKHQLSTGVFFAEKLVAISNGTQDVLLLAKAFYENGDYQRAIHLLSKYKIQKEDKFIFYHMMAQCMVGVLIINIVVIITLILDCK